MISYAQNFEDVILERLFKDRASGFYVDIGACHPVYDSVTHHFYLKGWQGINVEPQPKLFAEIRAVRERDINLQCCVGSRPGRQTLYITRDLGTSTLNPDIAQQYRKSQRIEQELTVDLVTLDHIWSEHVGDRQVDFMKIDVEGFEKEVLSGADFSRVAPAVLVIEATVPDSRQVCHEQWEGLIQDHYEFIYFDGLNRFYRRKGVYLGDLDLAPPNFFDRIRPYRQVLLEQAREELSHDNEELRRQLSLKDEALDGANKAYAALQEEYRHLYRQQAAAGEALAAMQAENARVQQAYESLLDAYGQKEQPLVRLAESVTDIEALKEQLRASLEQLSQKDAALADAGHAYAGLQTEYRSLHRQLAAAGESLAALQTENDRVRQAYESLLAAYEQKEKDLLAALGAEKE